MPAPASEDDLKRRARRRLIGAVTLTLVAVIALPLLLEDEPPPAERLEVRMPPVAELSAPEFASPPKAQIPAELPEPLQAEIPPVVPVAPTPPEHELATPDEPNAAPDVPVTPPEKPAQKPKPAPPEAKPKVPSNVPSKPESKSVSKDSSSSFVVQLGAFSDAEKAMALKDRAADLGLPTYTDKSGSLTRLRVGPFPSRQAAIEAAETLADDGVDGQVMPK